MALSPTTAAAQAARSDLLRLHRALWRRQRVEIEAWVEAAGPTLRAYEAAYRRRVRRFRRVIGPAEALTRARAARVVYVGDYHTLARSQRAYVSLVRGLALAGRPLVLALELVPSAAQGALDRHLAGRLSETGFLRRIRYPEALGFPLWPHFRPVIEAARELGLPVLALDLPGESLTRRDAHAGDRIAAILEAHPEVQVVALVGQLHAAPSHLPRAVRQALRQRGQALPGDLIVYQNCEPIYWRLAAEGREHSVHAVELGDREICLIHTSPVVAQQSYIDFLHYEDPLDPALDAAPEGTFRQVCATLADFLEVNLNGALDRVTVLTTGELGWLEDLLGGAGFSGPERREIHRQMLARPGYFVPRAELVYLASPSVNHAAEAAARFLRYALTEDDGARDGLVDAFYARALDEAVAFFGSKVINPRRRCAHPPELVRRVEAWERGRGQGLTLSQVTAARRCLTHVALEAGRPVPGVRSLYQLREPDGFHRVTRLLGARLGDRLYYGVRQGRVPRRDVRDLFLEPADEPGEARTLYFHLIDRLGAVRIPSPASTP